MSRKGKNGGDVSVPTKLDSQKTSRIGESKFDAACYEINKNIQNYISTHQINLEEDDNSEEDEEQEKSILGKVIAKYESSEHMEAIEQKLHDALRSGGLICLICIDNIKKKDGIWSCNECSSAFHLGCIQKWAKDSIFMQSQSQEEALSWDIHLTRRSKKELKWCCPKCRLEYNRLSIPTIYKCFCNKKENPAFDPWLIPHSCGETCSKKLRPECGHTCHLLCHPEKCPPCPVMIQSGCYCGKNKKVKRCSSKAWSCEELCGNILGCNQHKCSSPCHSGACDPCPKLSNQECCCGAKTQKRKCAEPKWQCDKVCNRQYSCGHHACEAICHIGPCGDCPQSGVRTCSCGKTSHSLPCTQPISSCGDTCSKLLACGIHYCLERCHKGSCPLCLQLSVKKCSCGSREKEVACSKNFTCENKCKRLKDCKRHSCNRKCCLGDCLSCEHPCNKMLPCKNHKCESRCHPGPCYPCPVTHTIACSCGKTSISVPCGRERKTSMPKCSYKCMKKSNCHHPHREPHKCHPDKCPPCTIVCDVTMTCSHKCPAYCHDAVSIKIESKQKRAGPWEKVCGPITETKKLPHPLCMVKMPTICLGEHETPEWPCNIIRQYSCGRKCGRILKCSNHSCDIECHKVEAALSNTSAGTNCNTCHEACKKPRSEGCPHVCMLPCHPGPCPLCSQMIKMQCHCNILPIAISCDKWIAADDKAKEAMRTCSSNCCNMMSCGHKCQKKCHSGICSTANECHRKVSSRCPCKRIRKEVLCRSVPGKFILNCDSICLQIIEEKKQAEEAVRMQKEEVEQRRNEEERKRNKELEELKSSNLNLRRRKRPMKVPVVQDEETEIWWHSRFVVISFIIFIIIVGFLSTR